MSAALLAIDAGNTRIKCGVHDGTRWTRTWALPTARAADLAADANALPPVGSIVISNVAGESLRQVLMATLPSTASIRWIASTRAQCGVRNGYADPMQLGSDRWAALIAARHIHGGAALVVNAGTALTVDALSSEGIFLGGIIVAGPNLMYRALAHNTAALDVEPGRFDQFPKNTADAIASGAVNALCGAIERMAAFLASSNAPRTLAVVSGGAAALVAPRLNLEVKVVDNLVLEGLAIIARDG